MSVHATDDNASDIYILNGSKGGQLYNGSNLCDVFTPFRVICSIFRRLFVEQLSLIDSGYAENAKQKDWIVV